MAEDVTRVLITAIDTLSFAIPFVLQISATTKHNVHRTMESIPLSVKSIPVKTGSFTNISLIASFLNETIDIKSSSRRKKEII